MAKKKFDLNNPATQYISTQNEHTHTHNTLIPPGETKSRRFSLLLYPSLHKKARRYGMGAENKHK